MLWESGQVEVSRDATRKLRLLFVDHTAQLGGAEIALQRFIRDQSQGHVEVVVFEDGPLVEELRNIGAWVHVIPLTRTSLRAHLELGRFIRARRFDAVIANSLDAGVAVSRVRVGSSIRVLYLREGLKWLSRRRKLLMIATAFRNANAVLANSGWTANTAFGRLRKVPTRVVYTHSGVRAEDLVAPKSGHPAPLRVISLSRIVPWKGVHTLFDAIAMSPTLQDSRQIKFEIFGSGVLSDSQYEESLARRANSLGRVVDLLPHTKDTEPVIRSADVLLHLSTQEEPLGQVVVQALASDLVLITTALGGPSELVENGENAIVVTPNAPFELAEALESLLTNEELLGRLRRADTRIQRDLCDEQIDNNIWNALRDFTGRA